MENQPIRRLSLIYVLLVVAALCAVSYLLATQLVKTRANRLKQIDIPARSNQKVEPLGDGLIYYDGATLHAMDDQGRQIWSYAAGSMVDFSVGEGGVAVWSGVTLSLLPPDSSTALFSGPLDETVLAALLGKVYAAVQIGEEHNSTMLILDSGGRQMDRIDMSNQTILDFGFFNNGLLFWVMSLDTEGTVPLCSIRTYKPGKMQAGTIPDTSQVLYRVLFQSTKVRVVGLEYIKDYAYTGQEIPENRILVYGWYLVDADERQTNPLMVFVPMDQADGTVGITDIRTIQDQTDQTIRLPAAAKQVFALGDTVYAFSIDRVMVCRPGAVEPDIYTLPMYIDSVLALTDNHTAIITSGGNVHMIPLP